MGFRAVWGVRAVGLVFKQVGRFGMVVSVEGFSGSSVYCSLRSQTCFSNLFGSREANLYRVCEGKVHMSGSFKLRSFW